MGALTSNRKRGDDSITLNLKSPFSNSLVSEVRDSKKPRLLPSASETTIENRLTSVSAVSKYCRYPDLESSLKREPHAPVRTRRVSNSVNFRRSGSGVSWVNDAAQDMGNLFSRYQSTRRSAIETLRYTREYKEITGIDKENENEVVSEDSSVEEVEILDDGKDPKLKEGDGPAEDKTQKLNGMTVERERDSHPSCSSAVTNLTYGNLKVESPEKLLESLQLDGSDARVHKKLLCLAEKRNAKLSSLNFEIELNEKKWQQEQLLRPQKKEEVIKKDAADEAFKPLAEEEEAEVSRALSNSSRRKLLVTHESSNISITGELLQCLRPGAWLNDEVINLYLELLKEREKREPQKFLKCHFFNTFFYKRLVSGKGYDFQSVRRWTSKRKLGYCLYDCDKIFIPIHKQVHWCLAVINKKDEKFQYLDSLGGSDSQVMKAISRFFVDEVKDKSGKDINVSSWQKEFVGDLPEQENGFDCGVFMIKYADFYSRDIGLCFSQEHMPYFRQRTAKEILSLKAE